MEAVRLGAFADYKTEDEYREQLRDSPLSALQIAEALASFRRQFSIGIDEFAILMAVPYDIVLSERLRSRLCA